MHRFRNPKSQDGAAAVELALVLPLLILLIFGIVQFSILYNEQQGLHAAAREGARLGALPQTTQDDIVDHVADALIGVGGVDVADATITVTPNKTQPCDLQPSGTSVVVTVSVPAEIDIPIWGVSPGTLTGRGEFKCE